MDNRENRIRPFSIGNTAEIEKTGLEGNGTIVNGYPLTPCQTDLVTGLQGKVRYEMAKSEIKICEQGILQQQRLQFENDVLRRKEQYRQYLLLMETSVYADARGDLMLAFKSHDGHTIVTKKLLNVTGFTACIFYSVYPTMESILHVTWEKKRNGIYFPDFSDGISPAEFLKCLKAKGILLLVSGRAEKRAADALWAYTVMYAPEKEIPSRCGWHKRSDGRWHFAWSTERTMKGLKK